MSNDAGYPVSSICPHVTSWSGTYLLPGELEWLSIAFGSDCTDHEVPQGLMTGRRVGGVEALHLFMTPLDKLRLAT